MLINKKRIRNCKNYLSHIDEGATIYIGLPITEDVSNKLKYIGFENLTTGESLVPSPKLGPVSKFNANGKGIPQKDQPMETAYRQQYHEWEDWGGNSHSRIVDIPYKRYPRKWIPSPWVELVIVSTEDQHFVVAGSPIIKGETEEEVIVHQINLMLEIFKRAEILHENLERYEVPEVRRLGWDVLPTGDLPWSKFQEHLTPVLEKKSRNKKVVIFDRIETISQYKPDFHAIGTHGYRGYIIFGFTQLNLYIFESAEYGNATYVFEGNWVELSKMSKAEIINGNLHKHRFIHLDGWKRQIAELFPKYKGKKIS
ncbi:hypothetical protein HNQ94_000189 [Salirhabdus euzebyi]|uniref:Uncharacterized protein n=1 Tax=Salirhabdus euzebyi TaxID=394506 RepID=A0A841Q2W9_9BACI|nr:hypothetical protein [Salirhabdus euzebyi]MBB6451768.1 hypothetical protein [Salirhabdus euzebyi]